MTPWMDAIDKLRSLGYAVTLDGERLRYSNQGKGNPSQDEIAPLLNILKAHKREILNDPYFLIEQTLEEINKTWQPGTLEWMKRARPKEFEKVQTMEKEINRFAFGGDLGWLKKALSD